MNLVRLSFIFGMIGLAVFSINAAIMQPYHDPVLMPLTTAVQGGVDIRCKWDGGYDRVGFVVIACFAIVGASSVALTDLIRRVY